jgi:hypothetical protein
MLGLPRLEIAEQIVEQLEGLRGFETAHLLLTLIHVPQAALERAEAAAQQQNALQEREKGSSQDAANALEMKVLKAQQDQEMLGLAKDHLQQRDELAAELAIKHEVAIEGLQRNPQDIADLYSARDLETLSAHNTPEFLALEAQQAQAHHERAQEQTHAQSELSARLLTEPSHRSLDNPEAQIMEARHAQEKADVERSIKDGRDKLDGRLDSKRASSDTENTLRDQFEAAARMRRDDVAARQAEEARQLLAQQERDRDSR